MHNVLIVGGGRVGARLATLLAESGAGVVLIERNSEVAERLESRTPDGVVVHGDGTDPDLLERCGIHSATTVAAVTDRDETNLVVTSLAKFEFEVARTIGRVNNPRNAWLYSADMGVDVMLDQAEIMGKLIVEEMSMGDMVTLLKLRRGRFSLVERRIEAASPVADRALADLRLPPKALIVAVLRGGELLLPDGSLRLLSGDEVLVLVHSEEVTGLENLLGGEGGR